jgi:hypothetical protein
MDMASHSEAFSAAPASRNGWFPVPRAQLAIIGEQFAGESAASATCVYLALLSLCNEQRSTSVEARLSMVARVANVSYPTAIRRIHDLEKLGIVTIARRSGNDKKTPDAPSIYMIQSTPAIPLINEALPSITKAAPPITVIAPAITETVPPITEIPPTVRVIDPAINMFPVADRHVLRNKQENNNTNVSRGATGLETAPHPGRRKKAGHPAPEELPDLPESLQAPEFLSAWSSFVEHRKDKKAPLTRRAAEILLRRLAKWEVPVAIEALENSIMNGWTGVFLRQDHAARPPPAASDLLGIGG